MPVAGQPASATDSMKDARTFTRIVSARLLSPRPFD
jgi:hypothetical protein